MSWNYRVIKSQDGTDDWFSIHSAYYDNGKDVPHSISVTPATIGGNSLEELKNELQRMLVALEKPVLDENMFNN